MYLTKPDWLPVRTRFHLYAFGLFLLSIFTGNAIAQSTNNHAVLEEVVVSAQKRGDQRLQDTSISIQAFGEQELKDRLVKDFKDLAFSIPGLQLQDIGPGDREYILRGINSSGDSTVGVYYDEAVITASNAEDGGGRNAPIQMYDMQQVEVLKGPQGTLYGANSMSGTIRFITNKPKLDTFEGYLETELSSTRKGEENYGVNGMINIPIIDDVLAIRAVGWIKDMGGYIDAIRIESGPLDDVNTEEVAGGRVHLRWTPNDDLMFTLSHTYQDMEVGGTFRFMKGPSNDLSSIGFPPVNAGDLDNTGLTQDGWDDELNISSLVIEYKQDYGIFTAASSYFSRDLLFRFDNTGVVAAVPFFATLFPEPFQGIQPVDRNIWSTEIRFASAFENSPVQFVLGGFHSWDDQDWEAQAVNVGPDGLPAGPFTPGREDDVSNGGNTIFGRIDNTQIREYAVFGEVTYDFMDQFQILWGGRWFKSEFDSNEFVTHPFSFSSAVPFAVNSNSDSLTKFTWKTTLSWFPTDDLRLFATRSLGARRGGLNNASLPLDQFAVPEGFDPDEITNYELGVKWSLFDKRLQVNATAYHMEWDDIQLEGIDDLGVVNFIGNFGNATVDGIEFDATLQATDRLWLFLGWSYQDATLDEDNPDLGGGTTRPRGLKGDTLPNIPDFQGSVSLQYEQPLWTDWLGQARFDVVYRDNAQTEFNANIPTNIELGSYTTVNANFSLIENNRGWRVNLFVENLTDERADVDAFTTDVDQVGFVTTRPRTIGVNFSKRF